MLWPWKGPRLVFTHGNVMGEKKKIKFLWFSAGRIRHITSLTRLCHSRPFTTCVLYQQIKKEYGSTVVPAFPPKKIFTLTPAEVEQRREQLEKYMQAGMVLVWDRPFSDDTVCVLTSVVSELTPQLRLLVFVSFEFSPLTVYVVLKCEANTAFLEMSPQQLVSFRATQKFHFEKNWWCCRKWVKMYRFGSNWGLSRLTLNSPHKHMNKHYWQKRRGFVLILCSTDSNSRTRECCLSV